MKDIMTLKLSLIGWLLAATFITAQAQVSEITLRGSTDQGGVEGDTITVPLIVDTEGLTGENILAFRVEITSSSNMKPIGFSTANTAVSNWNYNINQTGEYNFIYTAAGTSPIAEDSVVILYIDYELQEVQSNTTGSYYLVTNSQNYFNEGDYNITMQAGQVSIQNRETLSVTMSPNLITRGDSAIIYTSGGTTPYTYSVNDPNLGQITSENYLLGLAHGNTTVSVQDANGLIGTSGNVEIRGFRLTGKWPENQPFELDTAWLEITTTDLSGLDVLAGYFQTYINGAYIIGNSTQGTLLENTSVQINDINTTEVGVSFASNAVLSGAGTLLKLQVVFPENTTSASSYFRDNVVFNEEIKGNILSSSTSVTSLADLSISAPNGIPNPIVPGTQIQFEVNNGVEPYTWSLSDDKVGTIDSNGLFTASLSGSTQILVEDSHDGTGAYNPINILDGSLIIASETAVFNSEHLLPVRISDLPSERGVYAFEMRINIDTSRITFLSVEKSGALSERFSILTNNKDPRQIRIAGAGENPIQDAGDLFYFRFQMKESFITGSTSLSLQNVVMNEGLPVLHLVNGTVTPGDPPPVAGDSEITIDEDEVYAFQSTDFVYSQPQDKPFARIEIVKEPDVGSMLYNGSMVYTGQVIQVSNFSLFNFRAPTDSSGQAMAEFEVRVGDADYFSNNSGIITFNVSPVNDPPRFELSANELILDEDFENSDSVTVVTSPVIQEAGEVYTYSLSPSEISFANIVFDSSTGLVEITAVKDSIGIQEFVINADDGQAEFNTSSQTFTLTINNVNDAPAVVDQSFQMGENQPVGFEVGTVLASDVDGDPLSYQWVAGNESGAFDMDSESGLITVSNAGLLDFEQYPEFILTVAVSDGTLETTATITISLLDVNDAPVIVNQTMEVAENTENGTETGTISATDQDADALTFSIVGGNEAGIFELNEVTGLISVANGEPLDFETQSNYTLTVNASDGLASSYALIQVLVTDVNESPMSQTQTFRINESSVNGFVIGTVMASDPEGDQLSYIILSGNESGAFVVNSANGQLTVADQSLLDYETTPSFILTVEISDGEFSVNAEVVVELIDIDESTNQAPQIQDQTLTVDENSANNTVIGTIKAGDPEGSAISYMIISGNNNGLFSLNENTGELTVLDGSSFDFEANAKFEITVSVSDGQLTAEALITITLNNINEQPVISESTFNINENLINNSVVGMVTATDPDGDVLTFAITSGNDLGGFSIETSTGIIRVLDQTQLDFETTPQFVLTVQVYDGALSGSASVSINLNDVDESANQAPQIQEQTFQISELASMGTSPGFVQAGDSDGDDISFAIIGGDSNWFGIDATSGELTLSNPNPLDFESIPSYQLTIEVSDGELAASAQVTLKVLDENEAPIAGDVSFTITENSMNGTVVGSIPASDPEGDALSFLIVSGNENSAFTLDASSGQITVADQSQLDFETTPQFVLTVQISDGEFITSITVTIDLNDVDETVNQAPQIADQSFAIDENSANGTSVGMVNASDPDGDQLSFSITSSQTAFAINENTGEITVADQSQLDFETTPQFVLNVQVSDGTLSASANITIDLNDVDETVNQAPQIADQSFAIDENSANGTSVGMVNASDPDGDQLSFSITSSQTAFAINENTGEITVADQSQLDFETTPSFSLTVEVSDGTLTASATITINLNDINEPPIMGATQSFVIDENSVNGTSVGTVNASDPEGDQLTFSITGGNDSGAFTLDASTGELTVADQSQLDFETIPQFVLNVEVSDGALSTSASITINLNDVDETILQAAQKATMVVYPSPASDRIYINPSLHLVGKAAQLYNLTGQLLYTFELKANTSVNISELQSGVYLIKVQDSAQPMLQWIKE